MIEQQQIDKIKKLNEGIASAESKLEYAKGKLSAKKEELKEKFNLSSIKAAEILLDDLELKISKAEEEINELLVLVNDEYEEVPHE